ncbi:hypothetical protein [Flavobacterium sp.]|uniref:hypothetical protein n=1 Tax=Flavobacterium sp. TaxID=239 RepID=UPI00248977DA|nr:hypothetical protein [Flavobacterium sp.]MDI1315785.1 hypothetical protein [Flavobacterium sp.]
MKLYYVSTNKHSNGDHEVHTSDCSLLPNFVNRKYLGHFASCKEAVLEAKDSYPQSNGCKICTDDCHTA